MFVNDVDLRALLREGAIAAGADRADDRAVSRLVALDPDRHDLDSAVDPRPRSWCLYFLGETINTMTLGGLALAIGILVDDSTVTIENTHRLLTEEHMPLPQATLHGAAGIAVPTLVSTLAISCVFVSVVFLHGPAKFLFTPLGLAVVFAMLASYALVADPDADHHRPAAQGRTPRRRTARRGWFGRLHARFEHGFEAMRQRLCAMLLTILLRRRCIVPLAALS